MSCQYKHRLGRVQRLWKHLHPVEDQVVGFAQALKEVVQLLSLNPSIVVVPLAEPKADLEETFNCSGWLLLVQTDILELTLVSGSITRLKNINKLSPIGSHPSIAVVPASHVVEIAACFPVGPQLQVTRHPAPFKLL